ncbi:MAG: 4-alpha-glucanotransferase [Erythrobacter cryptus]
MMTPLDELARACGLARSWRDVEGRVHRVSDDVLAAILAALGHETASEAQIARARAAHAARKAALPRLLVADAGQVITLPFAPARATITGADGITRPLPLAGRQMTVSAAPGYYDLALDRKALRLAVAPPACPLPDATHRRPWGVAVQIPALRGRLSRGFGTLGELAEAAAIFGKAGTDALAINPLHALFPGHGRAYSPYSPSSRLFLNTAMADPALAGLPPLPPEAEVAADGDLIDWQAALPRRLAALRDMFRRLDPATRAAFIPEGDAMLARHALFDALDSHFRPSGAHGWRDWPRAYQDPESPVAARFAAEHAEDVAFHTFLQGLARQNLAAAHAAARGAGMGIGLIGDLAVGVDPAGSDAWSLRHAMLKGLTIGAPPDPLGPLGQNWSITSFSPEGLVETGYAPFLAMLRAGFAAGGGLRIDHAFGLARLWVIPAGGSSAEGAYLAYPFADLLRLVTLEAHLAGAVVIAEDLGTAPDGFSAAVSARQMLGMQVLWFARAADHGFIGAQDYPARSAAMSGTHDTPTIAGWWRGRDLDWAARLGRLPEGMRRSEAEAIRDWDRGLLWSTLSGTHPRPSPEAPGAVVDAAIAHIGSTPSALALVTLEDLLAEEEQPNLPGTVHEHPNWRRRLPAPLARLVERPEVARRLAMLRATRQAKGAVEGAG